MSPSRAPRFLSWSFRPAAVGAAVALLAGCSTPEQPKQSEPPKLAAEAKKVRHVEATPEAIALGKASFGVCIGCHGDKAEGRIGIGPRIASESYLAAASDDFLLTTIREGRTETTMVPWKESLEDNQIKGVVAYLRSLHPVEPADLDESSLRGDPKKGETVFRDVCSGCHGRTGAGYQETANGTGIGRKAFLKTASNGFIRYIVRHGKTLTKMRGFAKKEVTAVANLKDDEIEHVIAFLRDNAW